MKRGRGEKPRKKRLPSINCLAPLSGYEREKKSEGKRGGRGIKREERLLSI